MVKLLNVTPQIQAVDLAANSFTSAGDYKHREFLQKGYKSLKIRRKKASRTIP